jgi:hypothetical protein
MFGQLFKYQHRIQKKNFHNNKTIGHKKFSKRKIESSSEDDIIEEQYTYNDTESSTCSDVYDNEVSNTKQKKQKYVKENNIRINIKSYYKRYNQYTKTSLTLVIQEQF